MKLPRIDIFKKYGEGHLPRPQPSDMAVHLLNEQEDGFFVDIGAFDGVRCSNSVVFEEGYSWSGICVEPNPETFQELVKWRPHTRNFNIGMGNENGSLEFWKCGSLSGFEKYCSSEHKQRIINEVGGKDDVQIILVPIRNTTEFLQEQNVTYIDYLSIDAEGGDLEIIKSIDFNQFDIKLISIEADHSFEEIKNILQQNGFKYVTKCCADNFFIK